MPNFRIINAKGLFHDTRIQSIMSVAVFEHLCEIHVPSIADPAARAAGEAALAAVDKMPVHKAFLYLSPQDAGYNSANDPAHQYGCHPAKTLLRLETAKSSSKAAQMPWGSPKEAGWLDIGEVARHAKVLVGLLTDIGASSLALREFETSLTIIKKKLPEVSFASIDDDVEFSRAMGVALFTGRGFLDSKGIAGPLSRARMFESPAAASRTAKSHRISEWKAMEVSLTVTRAFDLPGDSPQDKMSAAIARRESEALDQALNDAGIELLRAKLAELEAAQGVAAPSKAKPRL